MPILRVGSTVNVSSTGLSSKSFSYTLNQAAGTNRLVVVGVVFEEDTTTSRTVSSVTFSGVAMTQIGLLSTGSTIRVVTALYYLLDASLPATTGSKTVVVTLNGVCTDEIMTYVAEYTGVQQTTPADTGTHSNAAAGSTSITLTPGIDGSLGTLVCGSGGTTSLVGNENNVTTVQSSAGVSSVGGLGELLNQAAAFTFGYTGLASREACVGGVWSPAVTQTHQMIL